jgi:hypothetical protein
MILSWWLWFERRARASCPAGGNSNRARARLQVEFLEDRLAPAVLTANEGQGVGGSLPVGDLSQEKVQEGVTLHLDT